MKYFTDKLWADFGSPDEECRRAAEIQWENNYKAYWSYLQEIESVIPKDTMHAIYEITNGTVDLHDCRLTGFELYSKELEKGLKTEKDPLFYERTCHLKLSDGINCVDLVMLNVKKVDFDIAYDEDTNAFDVCWGYCEFSYTHPYVTMAVLFDSGHVCKFVFSSLLIQNGSL